jgi:hypothetical protein
MYKGSVKVKLLNVRDGGLISSANDKGNLAQGTPVEGDQLIVTKGYQWLLLTSPAEYAGFYAATGPAGDPGKYMTVAEVEVPAPPTIDITAPPGLELGEITLVINAKLDGWPLKVDRIEDGRIILK